MSAMAAGPAAGASPCAVIAGFDPQLLQQSVVPVGSRQLGQCQLLLIFVLLLLVLQLLLLHLSAPGIALGPLHGGEGVIHILPLGLIVLEGQLLQLRHPVDPLLHGVVPRLGRRTHCRGAGHTAGHSGVLPQVSPCTVCSWEPAPSPVPVFSPAELPGSLWGDFPPPQAASSITAAASRARSFFILFIVMFLSFV